VTAAICPLAAECESCGTHGDLAVLEADTPLGVICLTLCDACADAGRTPRLSCVAAALRALEHGTHIGAEVTE
jgi:hypothetical protein